MDDEDDLVSDDAPLDEPPPPTVPAPRGHPPEPPIPPREAIAEVRVRAPTRGNRRLERFLEAVNADRSGEGAGGTCRP